MAGDWIKVETSTSHKAEVLYMAELLGVSRQECMGYLIDYWSWLDANARTEFVPNLSRSCLDSVMNCPGIAAALEHVGWLKWDQNGAVAQVVNYGHHNGASAKTRAYEQKKKQAQRGQNRDKTGTREEKRREEITPSLRSGVTRAQENADSLLTRNDPKVKTGLAEPTPQHRALALENGVDCDLEWSKYTDWLTANSKRQERNAGFRNWLRRAKAFYGQDAKGRPALTLAERRADNVAVLTGQKRSIDGIAERVGGPAFPALPDDLREPRGDDVG